MQDSIPDDLDLSLGMQAALDGSSGFKSGLPALPIPEEIAGFRIVRELGSGGMGMVFEAEQLTPRRRVAIKLARTAFHWNLAARFENESQLLGRLHHPAIADVYEAGVCEIEAAGKVPYFVMALVEGARSITESAREHSLSLRTRLDLFKQALEGVEHGHARGVIHRDLKPSNLLVDSSDRVKIIDFGLARATSDYEELATMHTRSGELLGTPHYMSPEQWADPSSITEQTDIYSMGVVLFELLTGHLPYDLGGKAVLEIGEIVRSRSPAQLNLREAGPRSDLNAVVQKAMEKEPARRYATAGEFLADVRRYLRGQPVSAQPTTTLYQVRSFARRNRRLVAALVAILVVSVVATAISTFFALSASHKSKLLESRLYAAHMSRAYDAYQQDHLAHVRNFLNLDPPKQPAWEWRRLFALVADQSEATVVADEMSSTPRIEPLPTPHFAVHPNGTSAIMACRDGTVRLLDLDDGTATRTYAAHTESTLCVAWSPDGRKIASGSKGGDILVLDAETGDTIVRIAATGDLDDPESAPAWASAVMFGPSQHQVTVAVGGPQHLARVFDIANGALQYQSELGLCLDGLIAPIPGTTDSIVIGDRVISSLVTPEPVETRFQTVTRANSVGLSRDGRTIAFGRKAKELDVWDIETHTRRWSRSGHEGFVMAVQFSPNDEVIASGGSDHAIKIWDARNGTLLRTFLGHSACVLTLQFMDDHRLVSTDDHGTIKTWDLSTPMLDLEVTLPAQRLNHAAYHPSGKRLLISGFQGATTEVDPSSGEVLRTISEERWIRTGAYRPDSEKEIALGSDRRRVAVWGEPDQPRFSIPTRKYASSVAYSPDGKELFCGDYSGDILLVRATDGEMIWESTPHDGRLVTSAFTLDGAGIVVGGYDGFLALFDSANGELLWKRSDSAMVNQVAVHPNGQRIAAASTDGVVREYSMTGQGPKQTYVGLSGSATTIAYTPDGHRLFAGYSTGDVRLWSSDGDELFSVTCLDGAIRGIAVHPDGNSVAIVGDSPTLHIWNTRRDVED